MAADKERNVFDLTSLQLKAKPPAGAKRPAALAVKSWKNKPSLTVFSNVEGAPKYGIFGMNIYPLTFMTFLRGLETIADMPFVPGEKVNRKMVVYDKPSQDKQRIGDLVFGRDGEGIMYICLVSSDENYPKIPFMFSLPRQQTYEGLTPQEASRDYCLGCVDWWRALMPKHLMDNFVDETKEPRPGQGGGGGYGNNQGGYGGGSSYGNQNNSGGGGSTSSDDDLPF